MVGQGHQNRQIPRRDLHTVWQRHGKNPGRPVVDWQWSSHEHARIASEFEALVVLGD